jgi:hypothetical protein
MIASANLITYYTFKKGKQKRVLHRKIFPEFSISELKASLSRNEG